jgi:dihydropteroate synthase
VTQSNAKAMNYSINVGGKIMLFDKPKVVGILNITDDSFYKGSRVLSEEAILSKAEQMIQEGADILDVGAYSSRPGADDIPLELEIERSGVAIKYIIKEFPEAVISIDTFRSEVLRVCVDEGALICNDISGGSIDARMFEMVANCKVPYILMHMRGTPQTMAQLNDYDDIILEMIDYFKEKINQLNTLGVYDVIIDPGFGFAKNISQNYYLLKQLRAFEIFDRPILAGLSRKSLIYKSLKINAEDALNGTTALNMIALLNGANLLRVHDVKEAVETVKLFENYIGD